MIESLSPSWVIWPSKRRRASGAGGVGGQVGGGAVIGFVQRW